MLELIGTCTVVAISLCVVNLAQVGHVPPLPVWLGESSTESQGPFVFLTPDGHELVVLAPVDRLAGMKSPKKMVRVPLMNDLIPSVTVAVNRYSPTGLSYDYVVSNRKSAKDAIGNWSLVIPAAPFDVDVVLHSAPGGGYIWGGAAAHVPIAKQAVFPSSFLGRYVGWFHDSENFIGPGEELQGFGVKSSYRPGLTTAWFGPGKLIEYDQSWPREIFEKIDQLEESRWREKYVITAGPMYPLGTPSAEIADALRANIKDMEKDRLLSASSPFVREVTSVLAKSQKPPLQNHPATSTEDAVATVLKFSLGVE